MTFEKLDRERTATSLSDSPNEQCSLCEHKATFQVEYREDGDPTDSMAETLKVCADHKYTAFS